MKFCENCGEAINENAKFCSICGTHQSILVADEVERDINEEEIVFKPIEIESVTDSISDQNADSVNPQETSKIQTISEDKKICQQCSSELVSSATFCHHCGSKVGNVKPAVGKKVVEGIQNTSNASVKEWQKLYSAEFNRMYPHLAGCIPAGFGTRFLRSFVLGLGALAVNFICNILLSRAAVASYTNYYSGTSNSSGSAYYFVVFIIRIGFFIAQIILLRKNGMNFPDYVFKTRWVDIDSGNIITNAGIWKQMILCDLGPVVALAVTMISLVVSIIAMSSSILYFTAFLGFVTSIYSIVIGIGQLVAWYQIYSDKVSHRCWIDKLANAIIIDTRYGRDIRMDS